MSGKLPTAAVAVAALLLLAGCNGLFGGATGPDREPFDVSDQTDTVEPRDQTDTVEPTTQTQTTVDRRLRNGFDYFDTVEEHIVSLANPSATFRSRRVVEYPNGTVRYGRERSVLVAGVRDDDYYSRETVFGVVGAFEGVDAVCRETRWSNGSVAVKQTRVGNETTYETAPLQDEVPTRQERLITLFSALNVTANRTPTGNDSLFIVRANQTSAPDVVDARAVEDLRNVTFVAVVKESGLIQRYRLVYEGVVEGRQVRVVETVQYESVGNTTVPRPEWVDTALDELADDRTNEDGED